VKLGTLQVEALPELLELLLELLDEELLEELDDELLELDVVLELDELEEELELDELELDAGGSPTQPISMDEKTSGAAQAPQGFKVVFMLFTEFD
jgi:hypothetical protein